MLAILSMLCFALLRHGVEFLFNLRIIGNATSDFVIDCFLKLNSYETTRHRNSKLGIIYHHIKARVEGDCDIMVMSQSKIHFFFIAVSSGKQRFSV